MHSGYESHLRSISAEVSRSISNCGAVYHCDPDTQLGANESTVRQNLHFLLGPIDWSLEGFRRSDTSADPQLSYTFLNDTLLVVNRFFIVVNIIVTGCYSLHLVSLAAFRDHFLTLCVLLLFV